jgi:hypothetical protein
MEDQHMEIDLREITCDDKLDWTAPEEAAVVGFCCSNQLLNSVIPKVVTSCYFWNYN